MSDHLVAPHCWGQQLLASTRYRESRAPRPGIVWYKSFMTMLIHSTVYFPYILAAMMCLCIPAATPPSLTWLNFVLSMCPTWRQYQDAFFLDGWLLFQQVENWPVCSLWSCPCSWKKLMDMNSKKYWSIFGAAHIENCLPDDISEDSKLADNLHKLGGLAGPHHVVGRHRRLKKPLSIILLCLNLDQHIYGYK